MLVSRAETSFLIFFYKLESPNAAEGESLYAIDFGVKKHANLCHLAVFDIISDVHNELLQEIKRAQSGVGSAQERPSEGIFLINPSMLHTNCN